MIFGIGIDMVEVARMAQSVEKYGNRFLERIFTANELIYCEKKINKFQNLAARFAAKEAFLKALGSGLRDGLNWLDIEVINDPLGKPELILYNKCKKRLDENFIQSALISITHTDKYAAAVVVLERLK